MEARLEAVEGDLADHGVDPILDLPREKPLALGLSGVGQQLLEHQALAEDRGGLGQGQRRVGQQGAQRRAECLVHSVAQLMGQGQHVAPLAHIVHEDVGVPLGIHRVRIGARLFARPGPRIDPRVGKEGLGRVGELGREGGKAVQHHGLCLIPTVGARLCGIQRRIAIPLVEVGPAHGLGFQPIVAMADAFVAFHHRGLEGRHGVGVDLVGDMSRGGGVGIFPPAVLNLLFERQRIEAERQGRAARVQRLGQGLGRLLAPSAIRIRKPVQHLRQCKGLRTCLGRELAKRLVAEAAPVRHRGTAVDQHPLQVGRKFVGPRQANAPHPGPPARRRRVGAERRLDLVVVELVDLQRKVQAVRGDLRGAGAQVRLELRPGSVVARDRDSQAGVGAHAPQTIRGLLIEPDGLVQQFSQDARVSPGGDEPALERHQGVIGDLRGAQVRLNPRIAAAGIEVVEIPLGKGVGLEGRVHGNRLADPPPEGEHPMPVSGCASPGTCGRRPRRARGARALGPRPCRKPGACRPSTGRPRPRR